MPEIIYLQTPEHFSFRHTIYSHGWSELHPFEIDEENWTLTYVFPGEKGRKPATAVISETDGGRLKIELAGGKADPAKVLRETAHILRIDDDLTGFYTSLYKGQKLAWIADINAGRLMRSPTVYEDLVKTLCTTNCSWGLTKNMVRNLVTKLGKRAGDGRFTFPTAEAMAGVTEDFYRNEIKAGYRSGYFLELAERVASGELDPEKWLTSALATPELKKEMKNVKGVGDYAAETLMKLVGRYDGLALDSFLRAQFYKKYNKGKVCDDKKIHRFYNKYGNWRGLTIWCDMTERWLVTESE